MQRTDYISPSVYSKIAALAVAALLFFGGAVVQPVSGQVPVQQVDGVASFGSLEALEAHLERTPSDFQARRQYADLLYDAGRYREAVGQYERFLQHMQGSPDTIQRYLIAIAGYPGDEARGVAAAEKYLAIYPTDHETLHAAGVLPYVAG